MIIKLCYHSEWNEEAVILDSSTSSEWQLILGWQIILNAACQAEFSANSHQYFSYLWCDSETSSEWQNDKTRSHFIKSLNIYYWLQA